MKAVLETDNSLVYSRIVAARSALAERLDGSALIDDEEFAEIDTAIQRLRTLEKERCSDGQTNSE